MATEHTPPPSEVSSSPGLAWSLATHLLLLLTFRHDGRGLPKSRSGAYWVIAGLYCFGALLSDTAQTHEAPTPLAAAGALLSLMAVCLLMRPVVASGWLLCCFAGALLMTLGISMGFGESVALLLVAQGWAMAAGIALFYAYGKRCARERAGHPPHGR